MKLPSFMLIAVAATVGALAENHVQAASVPVTNFSFESPAVADQNTGAVTSWTTAAGGTGGGGVYNPQDGQYSGATDSGAGGGALPAPADGKQVYFSNGSTIFQDVGALLPNTTYTLTVALGSRLDLPQGGGNPSLELVNGTDTTGTVLVNQAVAPPATQSGIFVDRSVQVVTGNSVTGDLTIVLSDGNVQSNFDNVRLNAVSTPEPAAMALLTMGGIGLLARRKRS